MECKRGLKWDPSLPKILSCMELQEKTSYLKTVHNEMVLVNLNNLSSV